jgi:glycosyltransferase involved in cell wall biosynthesis
VIQDTTQQPTVSVIIPTYNNVSLIGRTIHSVLAQTFTDYELLIIDDGSTDSTASLIESIAKTHPNVRYFYKPNGGVSSARNFGLEQARGLYISFLDSDDLWDARFLEKMVSKITEEKKLICFCGYIEQRRNSLTLYPKSFITSDPLKDYILTNSFRISTDNWLIKKTLIDQNQLRFTINCHMIEDNEFFSKVLFLAKKNQISYVPEYLSTYFLRPSSLSDRDEIVVSLDKMLSTIDTLKRLHKWFLIHDANRLYIKSSIINLKRTYLIYLQELLLLSTFEEFSALRSIYKLDEIYFHFKSIQLNNFIWNLFNRVVNYDLWCKIIRLLLSSRKKHIRQHKNESLKEQ